jgi:hypothetical protein
MPGTRIRSTATSPTLGAAPGGAAWAAWVACGLAATALLAAMPAAAQDLVILRDGARQAGALASCVGEVCVLDGRQLSKDEIAWLGLGRDGAPPASASGGELDEVHLASGEAVSGSVVGVSLGTVAMASVSYDRREVAWIRFAGAEAPLPDPTSPGPGRLRRPSAQGIGAAEDVLILRDGDLRQGELGGCDPVSCTMDGVSLPRATIAWIGFERADPSPPLVRNATADEVHLRDGTVHAGRLLRVTAEAVVIEPGSHPRPQVAWVHLGRAAEPVSPAPPGSAEHLYDAVIVVNVVERLDYWDDYEHGPHCEPGTATRQVRWTARLPARYSRSDMTGLVADAGPEDVVEVLFSEANGETSFALFEERVEQQWFVWPDGQPSCDIEGSYRPHVCTRSLTGKPLSIVLGWSPQTGRVLASNQGPDIDGYVDICSSSYLNVEELQPDWAPTQFSGSRAYFDGVAIEPTAEEVERLRAGEELILRGGVRFKAPIDCCVGNTGFVRAVFDVRATAEIRLTPRR